MVQTTWCHGSAFVSTIEKKFLRTAGKVVFTKFDEYFLRQHSIAVFTSFAAIDVDLAFAIFGDQVIDSKPEYFSSS